MKNQELMSQCEKFIAEHIEEPLTAANLAKQCGYSLYHFCHLFRAHFNMSVGELILQKKMQLAQEKLTAGSTVTEVAFALGYDTVAGFSKAFRKRYGMNASAYRKNYSRKENIMKNPQYLTKEKFMALGYCIQPKESEIIARENGAYWHNIDFKQYPPYPRDLTDNAEVAAWIHPNEVSGQLQYFFGFETIPNSQQTLPKGFSKLEIPQADYAVFEIAVPTDDPKLPEAIQEAWKYIFDQWLDTADKKFDDSKFCFEYYKKTKAYIYIPVK